MDKHPNATTSTAPGTPAQATYDPDVARNSCTQRSPFEYELVSTGCLAVEENTAENQTNILPNIADSRSALVALDADSHQITQQVRAKEQEDKETKSSYARHVRHYEEYWLTTSYAAGDPAASRAAIPAHPITVAEAVIDVRDRAMLLTSTSVPFRGDRSRALLWSDQFLSQVPILTKGLDAKIPALTLIADNAKHNQNGRAEEYGAFRNRLVELCPVGAISALYFVWFHVLNCAVPNFAPDFSDRSYGQYGRRQWYQFHVFCPAKQPEKSMTYDNHRDRVYDL
ncbi:hypothetical protein B0H14DRAFT_3467517 [Mycena olivaceomarginata]|nr:hypothetical protein B0H14DRAFT_3467517 [Mycena olivaceomarginata]